MGLARVVVVIVLVVVFLGGCSAGILQSRERQHDEGAVYLYADPLGPDADGVRVVVDRIDAIRADGVEIPLAVSLRDLTRATVDRQRRVAAGPLPAGDYAGFVVHVKPDAAPGANAAAAAETSFRLEERFTVHRDEALVLSLRLTATAGTPAFSVVAPPKPPVGLMAFVTNSSSNDITVFDKKALRVFQVIATGRMPLGIAVDPRTRLLYVAVARDDLVEIVDVMAGRITDTIRLTPGDEPVDVALTQDGRTLLVVNRASARLSIIDAASRFEIVRLPIGNGARSITLDRLGQRAFVFNALSNSVSVIDLAGRAVVRSIPTDPTPVRGDLNRRGDRLYVAHETSAFVTVINPMTSTVTTRFPVPSGMDAVTVDPSTDFVYLGARREFVVGVHDPFSFGTVEFIDVAAGVTQMVIDADENRLEFVNPDANRVSVFDRIRKRRVGAIDTGDGPSTVRMMGEN